MEIIVLYTFYGQKEMIPRIVEQGLKTMIIDDGYPEPLGAIKGIEVVRIEQDIPWNQPGARNLGFHLLDGWVLSSDIDHVITKQNIKDLQKLELDKNCVYYIARKENGKVTTHRNIYLMHKEAFERIGGYDEDFSGHYGYDDTLFNKKIKENLKICETEVVCDYYPAGTKLKRDSSHNKELLKTKTGKEITTKLRFSWHNVP